MPEEATPAPGWRPGRGVALLFALGFGVVATLLIIIEAPREGYIPIVMLSLHCFNVAYGRPSLAREVARVLSAWRMRPHA